jgi:hypothetical protein
LDSRASLHCFIIDVTLTWIDIDRSNGWRSQKKSSINGVCANLEYKVYPVELFEASSQSKDGLAMCYFYAEMIDLIKSRSGCTVLYYITDANGGSLKGRKLLHKKRPWMFVPSCMAHQVCWFILLVIVCVIDYNQFQLMVGDYFKSWDFAAKIAEQATAIISWILNHEKVRILFDEAQMQLNKSNCGRAFALAYLMACITRWMTHFIAFACLLAVKEPLTKMVHWRRGDLIDAQVRAATSTEKQHLAADCNYHCDIIDDKDKTFWIGLEQVTGDIEVLCYITNLAQKDSTRADQVLLCMVAVFLRFTAHPEVNVSAEMIKRIKKRWSDCDQLLFLLALILNPWEKLSCFGEDANLNHFKCIEMVVQVCLSYNLLQSVLLTRRCRCIGVSLYDQTRNIWLRWREQSLNQYLNIWQVLELSHTGKSMSRVVKSTQRMR